MKYMLIYCRRFNLFKVEEVSSVSNLPVSKFFIMESFGLQVS